MIGKLHIQWRLRLYLRFLPGFVLIGFTSEGSRVRILAGKVRNQHNLPTHRVDSDCEI